MVTEPALAELSGLAVQGEDLWAVADGGRRIVLHRLDPRTCAVRGTRTVDIDPYDVEDLAAGPGGTLWVADLGDNDRARETVAVVVVPPRGEPRLHRLTYPDGPHDAEALLVDATGVPHVVTKDVGRPAGIYRTAAAPAGAGPTPLVRVGEVRLPPTTTTGGPIGGVGGRTVTGAARSADGRVVALRTYTDAWLYPVPADGDLVAALASDPVQVPLPGEPQGEAVAFTADGTLLSASEARGGQAGALRAVPDAASSAATGPAVAPPTAGPAPGPGDDGPAGPPPWLPAAAGAGATVLLLGLVALGLRLRRH